MRDARAFRISGISSLAAGALLLIETSFYFLRGVQPSPAQSYALVEYAARNAGNIAACLLIDLVMLGFFTIFLTGVRRLIFRADESLHWLADAFLGLGVLYVGLALAADVLQGAIVVDVLTFPADSSVVRGMTEIVYVISGCAGLLVMGMVIALGSSIITLSRALPGWAGSVGYGCAGACVALVPLIFVDHFGAAGFRAAIGAGPSGLGAGLPLVVWMILTGVLMLRLRAEGNAGGTASRDELEPIAMSHS